LLFLIGALTTLVQLWGTRSKLARAAAAAICIAFALRYLWWRYEFSMPHGQQLWQQAWAWMFFTFEALAVFSSTCVYFFMSRQRHRPSEAMSASYSSFRDKPVDIFIATYNEPLEILERTIVGAKKVEHNNLRVWVLDDGAREAVCQLAADLDVEYVCRVKGKHAKAGNVNNGLEHALRKERKPEFILLLDADFVPYRNILKRTLPLFAEPNVGIVQTPQHFFNPDPIQTNLGCRHVWPDEQRFFFNSLLASKDAWGAAFCCGTSAIFRVDALVAAGGMATETVTEDMLTSFKFEECGYRTIFFNEMLSMGLAPEGLSEYAGQRARWCLGAIQQIYTRWSFAGPAKIRLISRFSSFDGVVYWASNAAFRLMMVGGPLFYWWTGTSVINGNLDDMIYWLAPSVVGSILFMTYFAEKRIVPIMTDVTHLLTSVTIVRTVLLGLVKPWGHPFKVTAKGVSSDRIIVQWQLLLPFAILAIATVVGMARNVSQYSLYYGGDGYAVNIFWSIFNVLMLCIACAVCVEMPKRRQEERFASGEQATIVLSSDVRIPCCIRDISLSGASVEFAIGQIRDTDEGWLEFSDEVRIPFTQVRRLSAGLAIQFSSGHQWRRALIEKLFTGGYENEVPRIRIRAVAAAVGRRLLA
jgi:cellulose synthase (UDP-forming)